MNEPLRVYVGCAANHEDAESQAVLEWSIKKHTSAQVEINWMMLSRDPESRYFSEGSDGWQTSEWATPFSGFRWAVPEWAGFDGVALYTDSDVIFQADIAELFEQPFLPGKVVQAKGGSASWRFCVSLWDCKEAKNYLPPVDFLLGYPASHRALCQKYASTDHIVQPFDGNWNCLDGENYEDLGDPDVKAIHYTTMKSQPHLTHAVPRLAKQGRKHWFDGEIVRHWREDLIELFDTLLVEADEHDYTVESYCETPLFGSYDKRSAVPRTAGNSRGALP